MSHRGIAEEKTTKSDPIYRNRLVNMLVNRILKHGKKIIGLSNSLSSHENDSTKDINKFTICFTWSNSRYSSKSNTCRRIDSSSSHWNRIHTRKSTCHSLVIRSIPKTSRLKYGFQIEFWNGGCCQREWRCHMQKGRDS